MKWLFGTILAVVILLAGLLTLAGFQQRSGPFQEAAVTPEQRAVAEAYLAKSLAPLPDGWAFSTFEPAPGISLRTGTIVAPNAKGTVVLVPGYTASLDLYAETIETLHAAGYTVTGIEQRGQAGSSRVSRHREMGQVISYDDLSNDLTAFIATLPRPIMLYANSMGGHIAVRMLGADDAPDVAAAMLLVPMMRIETGAFPYAAARAITAFHSGIGLDDELSVGQALWSYDAIKWNEPGNCNSDPAKAWTQDALYTVRPDLRTRGTTNGWVQRTMASTDEINEPRFLGRVKPPVLMFTAGRDNYVSTDEAARACTAMGTCERVHYEESMHCITQESDAVANEINARTVEFFDAAVAN